MVRFLLPGSVLALALFFIPQSARADEAAGKKEPAKKTVTLAHIKLSGSMDEKVPLVDPLFGQVGETFRQKLERIHKARTDTKVQGLFLEIDGLSVGWGKLHELERALARFRAAGKKVHAYVESGASKDYLLALACDEVVLPESTILMLTGLRAEMSFYKDLLEKIGVKADMIQMGDYKGAAEPYTRNSLSEATRKQLTLVLDDFYDHEFVGRIVRSRAGKKLTAARVKQLIDQAPISPRAALEAGLIDRVAYDEAYLAALKKQYGADTLTVQRDYGKKKDDEIDIFALYRKLLFGPSKGSTSRKDKVAVIYASGAIMTGKSSASLLGGETVGSETLVKAIREAEKDRTVKAIVLRVDSPGGSALASDLIWNELRKSKKPVIASMSDVAASGGYYISMAAQKIYAEPGTITGSIGVIGGKLATRGAWDKLGIKSEVIARGAHSGMLTSDAPFTPSEKKAMTAMMKEIYDQFLTKALQGRHKAGKKMTREQLLDLAGGRIWTGRQAKERGLIDEVGTLHEAILAAAKLGGLPADKEPELLELPTPKNPLDALFGSALGGAGAAQLKLEALRSVPGLAERLRGVDVLLGLRREAVWAMLPFRLDIR